MWRQASQYQRGRLKWIEGPPATDDPDDPTPEEIAAACEAIQAGWGPGEAERRYWGELVPGAVVQLVGCREWGLEEVGFSWC